MRDVAVIGLGMHPWGKFKDKSVGDLCRVAVDQALADAEARRPSVPERVSVQERTSIFEGLRVADFSWVGAGPLVPKDLANLGAHVIRVESEKHVDPLRFIPPWVDGIPNVSTGHTMANFNQSKFGLALDLQTNAGREVANRIVDWADVVIESFTPGKAAKLGLDIIESDVNGRFMWIDDPLQTPIPSWGEDA